MEGGRWGEGRSVRKKECTLNDKWWHCQLTKTPRRYESCNEAAKANDIDNCEDQVFDEEDKAFSQDPDECREGIFVARHEVGVSDRREMGDGERAVVDVSDAGCYFGAFVAEFSQRLRLGFAPLRFPTFTSMFVRSQKHASESTLAVPF